MPRESAPLPYAELWELARRARAAREARELGFLLVNDTHTLAPYRQAVLWQVEEGVYALSGVVEIEANAPYAHWVDAVCAHLAKSATHAFAFTADNLPDELAAEWADWWPSHGVWVPFGAEGGVAWLREDPWSEQDVAVLDDWAQAWWSAFAACHRVKLTGWRAWRERIRAALAPREGAPWWRQPRLRVAALALAVLCLPVRLTVLAPGELVPAHPVVIRAPLEGVVDVFHVQPNQQVAKDTPLFGFDEAIIQSRLEVARQALATIETDYRQTLQQALSDPKAKTQIAILTGRIEEKRAEVDFLAGQLERARVLSPQAGVVLMDDPSEWIGKPVSVGERIMRIAAPGDVEIEAWVPVSDAILLPPEAQVTLYLAAQPLSPVAAQVRYFAHEAIPRPDGSYAYRLRAKLTDPTTHRVGSKGTAKIHGGWVPLAYWVLRRPLATLRASLGV